MQRRALLQSSAALAAGGLAGCSSLPIIGCSPPDAEPPDASFRLVFEEEHADGQVDYAVVNEGPATFDEDNTGALVVHELEGPNDVYSSYKWFDSQAPVSEPVVESAKPAEPGSRGVVIQDRDDGWRPVEVNWGPHPFNVQAKPCRFVTLAKWDEPPAEGPDF